MLPSICVLMMLASPLLGAPAGDDKVQKEYQALEGKWKTVGGEMAGKPFAKDAFPPFSFTMGADGKSVGVFGPEEFRFTMTIDPTSKPKTNEIVHETGTEKGKTQYGIYKLDGDKLTVCVTPAGKKAVDRPKEFSTTNSGNVIFVFERVKEEKKP